MRIGLVPLNSSDNPFANLPTTLGLIELGAQQGIQFSLMPEVANVVSLNRTHQDTDPTLAALRQQAAELGALSR